MGWPMAGCKAALAQAGTEDGVVLTAAGVDDGDVLLAQGLMLREGPPDGVPASLSGTLQLGDCTAGDTARLASVSFRTDC